MLDRMSDSKRVIVEIGSRRSKVDVNYRSTARSNTRVEPVTAESHFSSKSQVRESLADLCSRSFLKTKRKAADDDSNPSIRKIIKLDSKHESKLISRRNQSLIGGPSPRNDDSSKNGSSAPQVEIINGRIVLKESSLLVANQDPSSAEAEYEEVEEGVHATCRYSSFSKKTGGKKWSIEQTKEFYKALQQCGTDFSVMETMIVSRSRKELKRKFFREESQHPELIRSALESAAPIDLDKLTQSLEN